jgi:hypothetical protein
MNEQRLFAFSSGCLIGLSVFALEPIVTVLSLVLVFIVTARNPQLSSLHIYKSRLQRSILIGSTIFLSAKLFVAAVISQVGTLNGHDITRSWIRDSLTNYSSLNFVVLVFCFIIALLFYGYLQTGLLAILRPSHDISEFNLGPKNQSRTTLDHLDIETKKRLNDANIQTVEDLMFAKNNPKLLRELSQSTGLSVKKINILPLK